MDHCLRAAAPILQRSLHLRSGSLTYSVFGDVKAEETCFYHHGWPGSRLGGAMLHHAGAASGVRIITVDRPGFGRSPYDPTHSLTCWPDRLGELADRLGVEKFSLLGASGGGPFAAAAARFLPRERVLGLGLVCPLGPLDATTSGMSTLNKLLLRCARWWPSAARAAWALSRQALAADPAALTRWALCRRDAAAMAASPGTAAAMRAAVLEGLARGAAGVVHEMALAQAHWGFELSAVPQLPHVFLWHGDQDPVAPWELAQAYSAIPGCAVRLWPGHTHTTLVMTQFEAALVQLAAAAHGRDSSWASAATQQQRMAWPRPEQQQPVQLLSAA